MIQLKLASDGGIEVDAEMRSSCEHVYAAGDVCTVQWSDLAFHWSQVKTILHHTTYITTAYQCYVSVH